MKKGIMMVNMHSIEEDVIVINLIAETQGEIYQLACEMGFDMEDFSCKYLSSEFCHYEMDAEYSVFQLDFGSLCMDILLEEFKEKNICIKRSESDSVSYSPKWVGEMYRQLFFTLKLYSLDLCKLIPFEELAKASIELEECEIEEAVSILTERYKDKVEGMQNEK